MDSIVIVGGGVIGTSVAYHLRIHGSSVTLLEKNSLGSGTTAASMGRFNWDAADPLGIFLQREAWRTYEPLVESDEVGFERCGYLRVAETPVELAELRETAAILDTYGLAFSGVFLVGAATQPVAGLLGDRIGHSRSAVFATVACSVGIGALIFTSNFVLVGGGLLVFGTGLAAFWPVATAHGMQVLPDDSRGGDWGAITTVFIATESLGLAVAGFIAEQASYDAAYATLSVCFLSTAGIVIWLSYRS